MHICSTIQTGMNIEYILAQEFQNFYVVCGVTYNNAPNFDTGLKSLKASIGAINFTKKALEAGSKLKISKNLPYPEVRVEDIVVEKLDALDSQKQIAINDINNKMQSNLFKMCVIDAMDYLDSYMKLLAAGIFITDANREDKYFEIIENAQQHEEPAPLADNATFDEEQTYIEKKKAFNDAQSNLSTLEKYLNSYDKLAKIGFIHKLLSDARTAVDEAKDVDEVVSCVKKYQETVDSYFNPAK